MRTIIASGSIKVDSETFHAGLRTCGWIPSAVLSVLKSGVDEVAGRWAHVRNISLERYPTYWKTDGRTAWAGRNLRMVYKAEAVLAFWDGHNKDVANLIDAARRKGLAVYIHLMEEVG